MNVSYLALFSGWEIPFFFFFLYLSMFNEWLTQTVGKYELGHFSLRFRWKPCIFHIVFVLFKEVLLFLDVSCS